jgi:hypothetical protein
MDRGGGVKTTRCFEEQVLRKRPYIRLDWCRDVLAAQSGARSRRRRRSCPHSPTLDAGCLLRFSADRERTDSDSYLIEYDDAAVTQRSMQGDAGRVLVAVVGSSGARLARGLRLLLAFGGVGDRSGRV